MNYETASYLCHHGVKGMKWGVRKDRDIVIRKGTKIQRISSNDEQKIDPKRKTAYVSYLRKDRKKYGKQFAWEMKNLGGEQEVYKITYKNKNKLIAPSKQKSIDAFSELMKDKKTASKIHSEMAITLKRDFQQGKSVFSKMSNKQIIDNLKGYTDQQKYQMFSFSLMGSKYNRDKYYSLLGKMGYNAVVDDVDSGGYSKRAIIVFDRYKDLDYKKVKRLY